MTVPQGFTNLQLELLKLYNRQLPEEQLLEIRMLLGQYFAKKATEEMDKFWEENNLSNNDMKTWANGHDRIKNSAGH